MNPLDSQTYTQPKIVDSALTGIVFIFIDIFICMFIIMLILSIMNYYVVYNNYNIGRIIIPFTKLSLIVYIMLTFLSLIGVIMLLLLLLKQI